MTTTTNTTPDAVELPSPLVFLDVETDGLHPGRRIWEYAVIRRDPKLRITDDPAHPLRVEWVEAQHHSFVAIDVRNSDPFGLRVGGFWERHPSGRKMSGKPPLPHGVVSCRHDAARDLMRLTFGAHVVGVNPAFDVETLAGLFRAEGYLPSWNYHLVDLVAMTVGTLNAYTLMADEAPDPVLPPVRSDDLSRLVGVDPPTGARHTALGDARWAARWFDRLTGNATAPLPASEPAEDVDTALEAVTP